MRCRLLFKNQCRCSCSRMELSAWIEREPDRRTGIGRKPTEPACTQDPATAAAPPSRSGNIVETGGLPSPRSNRNIPGFHQVGPFRSGGELQDLWIQICNPLKFHITLHYLANNRVVGFRQEHAKGNMPYCLGNACPLYHQLTKRASGVYSLCIAENGWVAS